jgi:hypothetical protein
MRTRSLFNRLSAGASAGGVRRGGNFPWKEDIYKTLKKPLKDSSRKDPGGREPTWEMLHIYIYISESEQPDPPA